MAADFDPAELQAVIDAAGGCGGKGRTTADGYELRPDAGQDFPPPVREWLTVRGFARTHDRRGPSYLRPWPMTNA